MPEFDPVICVFNFDQMNLRLVSNETFSIVHNSTVWVHAVLGKRIFYRFRVLILCCPFSDQSITLQIINFSFNQFNMKRNVLLVFLAINLFNVINSAKAQSTASPDKPSSRAIEDGGTGPYKA